MRDSNPESRTELTIGPLFIRSTPSSCPTAEIEPLGLSLEMATAQASFRAPLYRKLCTYMEKCELTDILLQAVDLPFEFFHRPIFAVQTQTDPLVPLEAFLVGLYGEYRVLRSVFAVFTELREMVEFSGGGTCQFQPLVRAAATLGFAVSSIDSYGRRLFVDVDWIPPQDRGQTPRKLSIDSTAVDFRPRPEGALDKGKWVEPKDCFARVLLTAELRKVVPSDPISLFTEAGKAELLSHFEWTPLARMTNKQARAARVRFVGEHPEMAEDMRKMAEAMQKAGLYSDMSTVWSIAKLVPALIAEARAASSRIL